MKRNVILMIVFAAVLAIVAACGSDSSQQESVGESDENSSTEATEDQSGGTLKIAIDGSPPTLDQPASSATSARDATRMIYESLVVTDSSFNPQPMLAESVETEDNQTYTFNLRQGVTFHNGKEMTAEDVVASMERWLEKSAITGNIFEGAKWTAEDDYTVVLELVEASSLVLDTMASSKQAAAIMPKEIVESAPAAGVEEYIGTGPFKFVEWKQDQYIHYTKFEDYQPVDGEPDGLAGKKEALVDDIYLYIVPDPTTRLTGLQTGEYDVVHGLPYDMYDQFKEDPNIETIISKEGNQVLIMNNVEGPASDLKMRQAINTALDHEDILMAAMPNEDLFTLDSSYMDRSIESWASDAGSEYYNQNDPEKAKQMLEDMGYDGEEFTILTTRDYTEFYNAGIAIQEQLKQIGMNVTLEVYDWPTMVDKVENNFSEWDAVVNSFSVVSTPPQLLALSPTYAGGVNDDKVGEMMRAIETAPTTEEAKEIWDELQLYAWEELLPVIQNGVYHYLYGYGTNVEGLTTTSGPIYWNVSVTE